MRTPASSRWYIPLVAGTEVAARSGSLTLEDPGSLVGNLPAPPPWKLAGLVLWLDASVNSSLRAMPSGRLYRWEDKSDASNHAEQPATAFQPIASTADFTPRGVDFKD